MPMERADYRELYEALANTAMDGYWIIDASSGRIKYANDTTCRMYGYQREEIAAKSLVDFEAAMPPEVFWENIAKVKEAGYTRFETQHYKKDGTRFDVEVSVAYLPSSDEFHAFQRELTGRKDAERKFIENEQRYNALLELSSDGVVVLDPGAAAIIDCNEQVCRQLGYSREELLALKVSDIEVIEDREGIRQRINATLAAGYNVFETVQRTKEGEFLNVLVKTQNVTIGGREIYQCIWRDVTKQKKVEQILASRYELMEFSFNHDLDEVLVETLNILENLTGSRIGFFHFLDDDQETLTLHAWSTSTSRVFCKAEGAGSHYAVGLAGVWVDCLHERKPVIHNDYASLPHKKGLPPGHAPVIREMVVPIFRGDRIKGIVGVGNKPSHYHEDDVETVKMFANLAWEIAERKIVESAMAESEERLRCITDAARDAIVMIDSEGVVCFWSPAAETIFGYSKEEVIGESLHPLLAPESPSDSYETAMEVFKGAARGGAVGGTLELSARRKADGEVAIELSLSSIRIKSNSYAVGIVRDVTQRKLAEEELKNSLLLNKLIIDSAQEGIIVLDTSLRYRAMNPYMEKLTGKKFAEVAGRNPEEVFPFLKEVGVLGDLRRVAAGEVVEPREFAEMASEIGRRGWINASYAPIKNADGNVIGVLSIIRDVTEYKIAIERLMQSQKMEAIGTLAGGIAHDFNNILGAIIGYTELSMADASPDDELYQNLQEVLQASARAKGLVQQILAFSRKNEKRVASIDIGKILTEALKLIKSVIPRTINIEVYMDSKVGCVLGDPTEIHQVIMNLCTNAYQSMAMQESGILRIRLGRQNVGQDGERSPDSLPEGEYVRLEVEDTGTGMDEATRKRIFEPYFTTKGLGKGTGLGLSTVHGIVTAMNGKIQIDSELGAGSRFSIFLPLDKSESIEPEASSDRVKNGKARILFVDDEPSLANLGSKFLLSLGYSVQSTTSPHEALRLFERDPAAFDLIITDQTMPGLTGTELLRRARAIRPDIPTMICTGYSDLLDSSIAKEKGIAAFVQKPVDRTLLGNTVFEVLEKAGHRH